VIDEILPAKLEKNIHEFLPSSFSLFSRLLQRRFRKRDHSQHGHIATANTTCNMEHRGGKTSGSDRKNGARAVAAGKKSNTKAKQGSQRGGRAGYM